MVDAKRHTEHANEPSDFVFGKYSPYSIFTAHEWSVFRADTPLTLTFDEVKRLRSIGDPIDLEEVQRIYLSLSRLLSTHVEAYYHGRFSISQCCFERRKPHG